MKTTDSAPARAAASPDTAVPAPSSSTRRPWTSLRPCSLVRNFAKSAEAGQTYVPCLSPPPSLLSLLSPNGCLTFRTRSRPRSTETSMNLGANCRAAAGVSAPARAGRASAPAAAAAAARKPAVKSARGSVCVDGTAAASRPAHACSGRRPPRRVGTPPGQNASTAAHASSAAIARLAILAWMSAWIRELTWGLEPRFSLQTLARSKRPELPVLPVVW